MMVKDTILIEATPQGELNDEKNSYGRVERKQFND